MSTNTNLENFISYSTNRFSWENDIIIIAGPTAVGKSKIAIDLAKSINGVIINADSVQVYKDLNILSARPNKITIATIEHCLYGYVSSSTNFSVANWLSDLNNILVEIKKKQKIPILVGGSGLYISAAVNGLAPIPNILQKIKDESNFKFNQIGLESFKELVSQIDPIFTHKNLDKHRLIRAYSVFKQTNKNLTFWYSQPKIGKIDKKVFSILISSERAIIYKNCDLRFNQMLGNKAIEEVIKLRNKNINRDFPIMKSLGVKWLLSFLDGSISYDYAVELSMRDTRNYAKRQMTWFRHNYIPKITIKL